MISPNESKQVMRDTYKSPYHPLSQHTSLIFLIPTPVIQMSLTQLQVIRGRGADPTSGSLMGEHVARR